MKKHKTILKTQRLKRIEDNLTKNDLIFKIKAFVERIDLSYLESNFEDSNRGPMPIPLWVPVCVWVYAYSQGQLVYRRVSKLCESDDNYYYLSGGYKPSEAYLETWKLRILPLIPNILKKVQEIIKDKGFLNNEIVGLDGVKVQAWASIKQNKTEEGINKEIDKINKKLEGNKELTKKEGDKLGRRKRKLISRRNELQERKELERNNAKREKMTINITSPDTVLMKKREGKWIQGVNLQAIINQDNIINVYEPSRRCTDSGLLGKMYDKLCSFLKVMILDIFLLADCGYWNIEDLKRFDPKKGYKIIIPSLSTVTKERNKKSGKKSLAYDKKDFKYDPGRDVYICKEGKELYFQGISSSYKKYKRKTYRAKSKYCKNCIRNNICIGKTKERTKILKITISSDENEELKHLNEYYNIPENKELYKKRGIINEPTHAHMFHNNGITRLHCINGPQIDGEIAMIILIDTLKKIWRHKDIDFFIFVFFCILLFRRIKIHLEN